MHDASTFRIWPRSRLRLQGLMTLILILGIGFGWISHVVRSAQARREVVAAIRAHGYTVLYDWQWKDGRFRTGAGLCPWPRWLVERVGIDLLSQPTFVDFSSPIVFVTRPVPGPVNGKWMDLIGRFEHLEYLDLHHNRNLTDDGLASVRRLTRLRVLRLGLNGIRGPGLVHLRALTRLETLFLSRMPLHDDDLAPLTDMQSLRKLVIAAPVSSEGLKHLRGLTGLRELSVCSTDSTLTDSGLAHLDDQTELRTLHVSSDGITDAGLVHLRRLTRLTKFSYTSRKITPAGVAALRAALPNLEEAKGPLAAFNVVNANQATK